MKAPNTHAPHWPAYALTRELAHARELAHDHRLDLALGNRVWGMAAGTVMARAALLDGDGRLHTTRSRVTIATAPALRESILAAVRAAFTTDPDPVRSPGATPGRRTPRGAPC
ncbi:MAG: hypothetical protein ACRDTD_07355 [Pseudonocardiaceae bacterium]